MPQDRIDRRADAKQAGSSGPATAHAEGGAYDSGLPRSAMISPIAAQVAHRRKKSPFSATLEGAAMPAERMMQIADFRVSSHVE